MPGCKRSSAYPRSDIRPPSLAARRAAIPDCPAPSPVPAPQRTACRPPATAVRSPVPPHRASARSHSRRAPSAIPRAASASRRHSPSRSVPSSRRILHTPAPDTRSVPSRGTAGAASGLPRSDSRLPPAPGPARSGCRPAPCAPAARRSRSAAASRSSHFSKARSRKNACPPARPRDCRSRPPAASTSAACRAPDPAPRFSSPAHVRPPCSHLRPDF